MNTYHLFYHLFFSFRWRRGIEDENAFFARDEFVFLFGLVLFFPLFYTHH